MDKASANFSLFSKTIQGNLQATEMLVLDIKLYILYKFYLLSHYLDTD